MERSVPLRPAPALLGTFIVFLALEYIRNPLLQRLRLQTALLIALPVLWAFSRERPWSRQLTMMGLFVLTGTLMLPFATNNFVVYMNTRAMVGMFVISLATIWLMAYRGSFKQAVWVWVGIMSFQAVWAITHQGQGYGSAMGDENDLALACDMTLPFAVLGVRFHRGAKRWICAGVALLTLAAIIVSSSRGGFLGLLAAAGYSQFFGARHRVRNVAIALMLGIAFYMAVPESYVQEMRTIEDISEGTAETRFYLWWTAARVWMHYPILGAGPDNTPLLLGQYQPGPAKGGMFSSPAFQDRNWSMTALHSIYFQLLSERGLVGVGLFASMLYFFFAGLRRLRRDVARAHDAPRDLVRDATMYALALESAMAGFLVAGAFLSMLYYTHFWLFTAMAVAHQRGIRRELAAQRKRIGGSQAERPVMARGLAGGLSMSRGGTSGYPR